MVPLVPAPIIILIFRGWEKIFLSEKTWHLGFDNPVAAYGFFVIWGLLSFKALLWLDKKLK